MHDALKTIFDEDYIYSSKVTLEKEANNKQNISGKFDTKIINYSDNSFGVKVNSTNEGLLFVSNTFYPGWSATVNGKSEEILKANYTFQAVPIQKGESIVAFEYYLASSKKGLDITKFSLLLIILLIIVKPIGKRISTLYT